MICFAILAHKDERALLQQIRNIRMHNGEKHPIVVYNGGANPHFGKSVCKKENVMYCPYSRPLNWGKLSLFHYDVMRWLEEKQVEYDYLAILDYDVLFVKSGFEELLNRELTEHDCIMKMVRYETDPRTSKWIPGISMWKEWTKWKPFFGMNHFYGTFNPMQVYRHYIVKRILRRIHRWMLLRLLRDTNVFALEEMLYITMAIRSGGKCKEYPAAVTKYLRVYTRIKLWEAKRARKDPDVLFVHPVKDPLVADWICDHP